MDSYNKSPLEALGYHGWNQYSIFKHHLKMPVPYLRVIMKNYRRDLTDVPVALPRLISKIHDHWWSRMEETDRTEKLYRISGVPALFIRNNAIPDCNGTTARYYTAVLEQAKKFAASGKVLYLHSDFENNSLLAASQMVKAVIRAGVTAHMVDFPTCIEEVKTWNESHTLKKVREAQVACIYMIGKEYSTDFTWSNLQTLVEQRSIENKVTLLSSHLAPADFKKRYKTEEIGVAMKFVDEKITKTLATLLKELQD